MKKIFLFTLVALVCLAGLSIFKDLIIRSAVAGTASKIVGAHVTIQHLSFSLLKSTVHIDGLEIANPSGFPKGILVSIPTVNVTYDRAALFKKKIHILIAQIDVKEVGLIKNQDGLLNIDSLPIVQRQRDEPKRASQMPFQIDLLTLGIGKIVHKDYAHGEEPSVRVHDVNIHKSYRNITSIEQLAILILAEPVKAAGIQGAKIYGAMLLTGVAILPVAAVFTFTGKDNAKEIVDGSFETIYALCQKVVRRIGTVTQNDAAKGEIRANIDGANVILSLQKQSDGKTGITVSARKFMFPQPDIAAGVLYQITEKL